MSRRRLLLVLPLLALLGAAAAVATTDRWLFEVLDPGPFDPSLTPPAPDYSRAEAWAALPELEDGADVALPQLPAIDPREAPADVFYVHPTTWIGGDWNVPIDRPEVVTATERGGTLIQASAFNACCAVYAPRYRQASGRAFTLPDARGDQAIDVAFGDVSTAFDAFLARTGERPFLVVGHSQGAALAGRLLRERIAGTPLQERLVAAYVPGAPLGEHNLGGLPTCDQPTRTGCVVAWNARGPRFQHNGFEFDARDPDPLGRRVCVNPLTWTTDGVGAPASANRGALFFDTPAPHVKPGFADARCEGGTLVLTTLGDTERDLPSTILLWLMGPENYHPIEVQLFYLDVRHNAVDRVAAWLADHPTPGA